MGKRMSPLFSTVLDRILFILAGIDNIHESLDEFEIQPYSTTGFYGNRKDGKNGVSSFSQLFFIHLFYMACNDDIHESSVEFEFQPDWTTDCGVSCL